MFPGFNEDTIRFFLDIRFHNDKSFMHAHHDDYVKLVQEPFYALIDALAPAMLKIDADMEVRPRKCLSRIYRDTRFTSDKSPYRDHLWIAFRKAAADKCGLPFYWFELGPERMNWGVGVWGENREVMNALRRKIAARPQDYLPLTELVKKSGFSVGGAEFNRLEIPPGIPEELVPLYKKREIYFEKTNIKYEWAYSPDLVPRVTRDFKRMAPVYLLLRGCTEEALEDLNASTEKKQGGFYAEP